MKFLLVLLVFGSMGVGFYVYLSQHGYIAHKPIAPPTAFEVLTSTASPIIAALDKYKAAHTLYPATLDQLVPQYLPNLKAASDFIYLTLPADRVIAAGACPGASLPKADTEPYADEGDRAQLASYLASCVTGARDFLLQSPDLHPPEGQGLEEWAQLQFKDP